MHRTRSIEGLRLGSEASGFRGLLALLAGASLLVGCGGSDPGDSGPGVVEQGPLLPFKTGNLWTYRVTEASIVTDKTTTIGGLVAIGGTGPHASEMAFNVITRKGTDLSDQTESWQAPSPESPERFVRYREISYGATSQMPKLETYWDPSKLHIDGRAEILKNGFTWREEYQEGKIPYDGTAAIPLGPESDTWTVVSVDATVTAAEKEYQHTVHFQKVSSTGATKDYWYKPNVGKIKETGTQTEELVSFSLK
jgi:hypothetical protein